MGTEPVILDCTMRDGGYYNLWDFPKEEVVAYLHAMKAARVDIVELGFRFLGNEGFRGPYAFTTDDHLRSLDIPEGLDVAVMVNASDLLTDLGATRALERLFPESAASSPVSIVRLACHYHEVARVLPATAWLSERGFRVGLNLMQIADRSDSELRDFAVEAAKWPVEVLYFADSTGSTRPDDAARIVKQWRLSWSGAIGVHTHDNMGLALQNTLRAFEAGASWLDSTVTGMGRGPGNARTEELVIEAESFRPRNANLGPLLGLIRRFFRPLKNEYGWGTNAFYFLSGKYALHPTYIQEMLGDARYDDAAILGVVDHLRLEGGKRFSASALDAARHFYQGDAAGRWSPKSVLEGKALLLLGSGPGVRQHKAAIESFVVRERPVVMALNTQTDIDVKLIDLRIACHPVRLLADCESHLLLPQPLIAPLSVLPESVRQALAGKQVYDFGLKVTQDRFECHDTRCELPTSLVLAYALAAASSGGASQIFMAGFDGFAPGDVRNDEVDDLLKQYFRSAKPVPCVAITPTRYRDLPTISVYGI